MSPSQGMSHLRDSNVLSQQAQQAVGRYWLTLDQLVWGGGHCIGLPLLQADQSEEYVFRPLCPCDKPTAAPGFIACCPMRSLGSQHLEAFVEATRVS